MGTQPRPQLMLYDKNKRIESVIHRPDKAESMFQDQGHCVHAALFLGDKAAISLFTIKI